MVEQAAAHIQAIMSLKNVLLPGVVIAGLYKKNVIQGDVEEVAADTARHAALTDPSGTGEASIALPGLVAQQTPVPPIAEAPIASARPVQTMPVAQAPETPVSSTPIVQQPAAAKPVIEGYVASKTSPVTQVTPPPPAMPVTAPAAGTVYKFLGNNKQQVVIVVRSPGEAFLPESHLQMLSKMLGACKLNLGDVAIVNDSTLRVEINILKEQLRPQKILLFGVSPDETGLPMHFPLFKDQDYGGCVYLHAPSMHELNQETEDGKVLKRKLWESLKKIFGV